MNSFFNFKKLFNMEKVHFRKNIANINSYKIYTKESNEVEILSVFSPEDISYLKLNKNPYYSSIGLSKYKYIEYINISEDVKDALIKIAGLSFGNNILIKKMCDLKVIEKFPERSPSLIGLLFEREFKGIIEITIRVSQFNDYISNNLKDSLIFRYNFKENLLYFNEDKLEINKVDDIIKELRNKLKTDLKNYIDSNTNSIKVIINEY